MKECKVFCQAIEKGSQNNIQKHPLKVFCEKRCSQKFRNFQRKAPVLESFLNEVILQRDSNTVVFS